MCIYNEKVDEITLLINLTQSSLLPDMYPIYNVPNFFFLDGEPFLFRTKRWVEETGWGALARSWYLSVSPITVLVYILEDGILLSMYAIPIKKYANQRAKCAIINIRCEAIFVANSHLFWRNFHIAKNAFAFNKWQIWGMGSGDNSADKSHSIWTDRLPYACIYFLGNLPHVLPELCCLLVHPPICWPHLQEEELVITRLINLTHSRPRRAATALLYLLGN